MSQTSNPTFVDNPSIESKNTDVLSNKAKYVIEQLFYADHDLLSISGVVLIHNDEAFRRHFLNQIKKHLFSIQKLVFDEEKDLLFLDAKEITSISDFKRIVHTKVKHRDVSVLIIDNMNADMIDSPHKVKEFKRILGSINQQKNIPIIISGSSELEDKLIDINYFVRKFQFLNI